MDFRQLQMFNAVVENAGFTAASQQLHVAQSAISRKIKLLEEELGQPLFNRVNKRIFITPAGETLLRHTRRIFQELQHASLEISELTAMKRGVLRIGSGMSACMYLLPLVIEKFQARHPKVKVEVMTGPSEKVISQIRNNLLDIGVVPLPLESTDLQIVPLAKEEMVLVASPRNALLAKRRSIRAEELGRFPMICFPRNSATRSLIDAYFERLGIRPNIAMESANVATIMPLVRINLGVSLLPLRYVQHEVRRGEILPISIRDQKLFRQIGLAFLRQDSQPKALIELVDLFRASA